MTSTSVDEVEFVDITPLAIRLEPISMDKGDYGDSGNNERIDDGEAMDDDGGVTTVDGKKGIVGGEVKMVCLP